jgi:hypothetical protein
VEWTVTRQQHEDEVDAPTVCQFLIPGSDLDPALVPQALKFLVRLARSVFRDQAISTIEGCLREPELDHLIISWRGNEGVEHATELHDLIYGAVFA